ncbi:MAG: LysE family transporter [Actinomycetota bacterium]|nr:LysE family transporter [Actinomycetota bacterium]
MSGFAAAFAVGVAVAAPVGPVGVLCIQRTLRGGVPFGLASGLGVATADGLYAALAALGLAVVAKAASVLQAPLGVTGGVLLLVLAYRAWGQAGHSCEAAMEPTTRGLLATWGSAFGLTLANPATIMSFAAIMAGLGAALANPGNGQVFVAGIVLGSLAWWTFLALAVGFARTRAPRALVDWAGRVSALIMGVAGVAALAAGMTTFAQIR